MLATHSQSLFRLLTKDFWGRLAWKDLKQSVETLARSLSSYANNLTSKNTRMEQIHQSLEVVRNIGNNSTVRYTGARVLPPTFLSQLGDAVVSAGLNVPVEICKLLHILIENGSTNGWKNSEKACVCPLFTLRIVQGRMLEIFIGFGKLMPQLLTLPSKQFSQ